MRANVVNAKNEVTLEVEGSLKGPWVLELERAWMEAARADLAKAVHVNLTAVGFVDNEGRILMEDMAKAGVKLIAAGPMMKAIVEDVLERVHEKQRVPGNGDRAA